jgi:3-isopropylmalate/(R)-2-methylmalate dehydratase small subunit
MGKVVFKIGDDVSTDVIYPGRFMATVLPNETPQYAFADHVEFNKKLKNGEIPRDSFIVAGQNFGCGSSREQAASCLKGYELAVVARDYSRIFLLNSINIGLKTIICPDIQAEEEDELAIEGEHISNLTTGKKFRMVPLPKARQVIIDAGGLIPYTRDLLLKRRSKKPE